MTRQRQREPQPEQASEVEIMEPVPRAWQADPSLADTGAYDQETRDAVLSRLVDSGEGILSVMRDTGIGKHTLQTWLAEAKEERVLSDGFRDMAMVDLLGRAQGELAAAVINHDMSKATLRDKAIALNIVSEQRRAILGPQKGSSISRLRIAWSGGDGAVELETGG